jgi:hypothetical protein
VKRNTGIEVWAQPGRNDDSNTLIAFYSPASPGQLSLFQSESDLEIGIKFSSAWRPSDTKRTYVAGKSGFWTVTSATSARLSIVMAH